MKDMKKIIIILLLAMGAMELRAQVLESREIYFKVIGRFRVKDTSFIIINGGTKLGVRKGEGAYAYSVYQSENGKVLRGNENIGYGMVVNVFPDSSVCKLNQVRTGSLKDSIQIGDLVKTTTHMPRKRYINTYFQLSALNIFFKDEDGGLIYDLAFLYRIDTPVVDKIIFNYVKKDFAKIHEKYKGNALGPALLEPMTQEGRFKGRIAFELMLETTPEELASYMEFVKDYPGKYMGADLKLAETYLTWVISGGQYPPSEIFRNLLKASKDPVAFRQAMDRYAFSIQAESMLSVFADSVIESSTRGNAAQLEAYMTLCRDAVLAMKDSSGLVYYMRAVSKSAYNQHDYRKAAMYTDSVIYYARQKRMYVEELEAYLLKTDAQVNIPQMNEARNTLRQMEDRIRAYKGKLDTETEHNLIQLRYQYDGWVNYSDKNYGRAIEMYKIAADLNNKGVKTYSSRTNNALIFKNLGLIYKDQGKNRDAISNFQAAAAIYDSINYMSDKAWVWNEIGAAHYNLGNYKEAMDWFDRAGVINRGLENYDNIGYGLSMTANCYSNLGKIDSAILLHKLAIETRREVNPLGAAYSWDQLGELYKSNAYKKAALDAYDSSRQIYRQRKDTVNLSDNYLNVGLVHHGDENYRKAIQYYDTAAALSRQTSAAALYDMALAWGQLQKKQGIAYYERAEKVSDSLKDLSLQFKSLTYMAQDLYQLNDPRKGDAAYARMERLMKEIGSPARQAMLYEVRASKYLKNGKLDSAYLMYDASRKIKDTVSRVDAIYAMLNMSDILIQKGKFDEALGWQQKALTYAREMNTPFGRGVTFHNLGFLYGEMGQLEKAMEAMDSALYIFNKSGNSLREASARIQKGMIYKDKGDYKTGLEMIMYADSVYLAEGALDNRRATVNNAGVVYFNQADYAKAIEYFTSAEQFFSKDDLDEYILLNRGNIAECYYHQKKYNEATNILEAYYPRAVKMGFIRIAMGMANIQAKIAFEQGQMDKAMKYATEAYQFSSSAGAADQQMDAMVMQGKVLAAKGNVDKAIPLIRAAVAKGNSLGLKTVQWIPLYELGILHYQQKRYDSAIHYLGAAVDIVEQNAGNVFGGEEARKLFASDARKVDLYNKIIASYVAMKDPKKASEYALRNAITAINSKYGQDLGFADSTLKADLATAEEFKRSIEAVDASMAKADTKEKKDALQKTRTILEEGYQNFIDERKEKYKDFEKFMRGNVNPEDFSNYKGGLPEDLAVISYVVNENQLYKFIVTNSTLEIVTTELDKDINVMVNEFIASLITPDSASGTGSLKVRAEFANQEAVAAKPFRETSEALYHVLMDDVLPVVGDKKKLCIIPSGKLSNIPYQCLGKMEGKKFRFLMEDYRVFYTNRMDMFRTKGETDRNISDMAAFGNPDKSLMFAGKEVLDIQKITKSRQVLTEDKATEQEARTALGQRKYVHFATHGTLDYVKPKQSYLTFSASPGVGDDGRLTIAEIDSLKAPGQYAELVTLSACETARPLAISEDWYVSPANSFLRKKFKTVVASLWQVNDEATGILMTEFYKNLEKMDKVDALRLAQQKLSNNPKYLHPYYWGGFVLYGDWR